MGFGVGSVNVVAVIAAFVDVRNMASTCAVGLIKQTRWWNGGYTYLHRDIPIYIVRNLSHLPARHVAFNTALAPWDEPLFEFGYRPERCYPQKGSRRRPSADLCLFIRDGTCKPQPEHATNAGNNLLPDSLRGSGPQAE